MNNGWEVKKLSELIQLEYGKPLPVYKRKPDGLYPVYGANGEINRADEYYYDKPSIIIGRKGSAGELNLVVEKFWPLDVTYYVTLKSKNSDLKFIYYLLSSLELTKLAKGVKPGINRNEVYSIEVSTPQRLEQKRIVAILDKSYAAIARAIESAKKNSHNARDLFKSYLDSIFANPSDGWEVKKLAEACTVFADGDWVESKDQSSDGVRLIQTGNIGDGFFKDRGEKARYILESTFKKLRCTEVIEGDILISRLPDPVGRSCILADIGKKMITAVDCAIVRFDPRKASANFFNYYFQSKQYLDEVDLATTGTTRKRVSRYNLGKILVPLPPPPEQQSIVARLDTLSAETKKLEAIYQQKLSDLEELKKSILNEAFSGRFTKPLTATQSEIFKETQA